MKPRTAREQQDVPRSGQAAVSLVARLLGDDCSALPNAVSHDSLDVAGHAFWLNRYDHVSRFTASADLDDDAV